MPAGVLEQSQQHAQLLGFIGRLAALSQHRLSSQSLAALDKVISRLEDRAGWPGNSDLTLAIQDGVSSPGRPVLTLAALLQKSGPAKLILSL
eukprot:CAMPEP_0197640404 /NCGR_PEP_ID=MMETSP1338-20131121/14706_1 /TAXON_ID=43686 ORGANISM="Pelagodinium beii, Strain RCC1491" /NCGR_SAMPLE_ID=MMETSP1338 /ASSEMBLY_ACC=CAM_ASM_000754 /LENGTH=91 /DNA_ID=CAMNT_0043213251 /DNA_START=23 /DNA_END=295 /DNA_ORIENTATION=+